MTPKGKTTTSSWIQCDKCSTHLISKDLNLHLEDCPPNTEQIQYNFIRNSNLYGEIDVKTNEDIKNLSSTEKDNLVFLSQSAMQICGFSISEWVAIKSFKDKAPVAKMVWPTNEKSLTAILLTKNALALSVFAGGMVQVSKIVSSNCFHAQAISLICSNTPETFEITPELLSRIKSAYSDKFLAVQNHISVMFFGRRLTFYVRQIDGELSDEFSNLRLDLHQPVFYKVSSKTIWKLFKYENSYEATTIKEKPIRIAGVDEELTEIRNLIKIALGTTTKPCNIPTIKSVLLFGNQGTGKTLITKKLSQEIQANIVTISAPDLYSQQVSNAKDYLQDLFETAIKEAPSIVILDEFDVLCPNRSNRISDVEKRILSTVLMLLDRLHEIDDAKVFILATSNKVDNIDPAFRRAGRLDREIEIPTPTPKNRIKILNLLLEGVENNLKDEELQDIGLITHGYVGADLVALCSRAGLNAMNRGGNINFEDFKSAVKLVRPSAMREVLVEIPNVKWTDIGGQKQLKLILKQSVEWPLKHAESFIRLGITPPRGVLMFGPPGCSKTMIAKALATESGLNFLSIKGPELFSKWVGESEKAVRDVFRKARQVAPSIIFFDEIDALGGERSSGSSTSVQERVLAQLLTELDGVTALGDVTILAATNRPDRIDKALLRPGRLDRIVYVPLPDPETRTDIFRIKFEKMPVLNVNIEDLVSMTEGYSGAEVNAVCHEAAMAALEESLEIQSVETRHFAKALTLVTPRTPASLIKVYEDYTKVKI